MVLVHLIPTIPYVVLVMGAVFANYDTSYEDQAKVLGANSRIRVAVMGVNGRGMRHLQAYVDQPNVEVAYVCDVDASGTPRRGARQPHLPMTAPFLISRIDAIIVTEKSRTGVASQLWICVRGTFPSVAFAPASVTSSFAPTTGKLL